MYKFHIEFSTSFKIIKESDVWDPNDSFNTDDITADFEEPVISHPLRKISFSELRDAIKKVEEILQEEIDEPKKDEITAEITYSDSGTLNQPSLTTLEGEARQRRISNFKKKRNL